MVFSEYPSTEYKIDGDKLSFYTRGDAKLSFRMAVIALPDTSVPELVVNSSTGAADVKVIEPESGGSNEYTEYVIQGDSRIEIIWD